MQKTTLVHEVESASQHGKAKATRLANSSGPGLAAVPYARDEDVTIRGQGSITHDVARPAKPDHDLTNVGVSGRHPQLRKFLQSLDGRPNRCQRAPRRIRIVLVEKGPQSLDVLNGVGGKKDHPILRGAGRGSSFAEPQL